MPKHPTKRQMMTNLWMANADKTKDESVSNQTLGDEKKDFQFQRALELVRSMATSYKPTPLKLDTDSAPSQPTTPTIDNPPPNPG